MTIPYYTDFIGNDAFDCKSSLWLSLQENFGDILWCFYFTECVPLLGGDDNGQLGILSHEEAGSDEDQSAKCCNQYH